MGIPKQLVDQFAKLSKPERTKTETTSYGTIVKKDNVLYVKLDGSEALTPISTTVDMLDGERVTVMIKNHSAIVTGNITSPAARTGDVAAINTSVSNVSQRVANITNVVYPVGSIYMSINDTNPALLFGGIWEQLKDHFLLAAGDAYSVGATGGEATHMLTVEEIPSHNHALTDPIDKNSIKLGSMTGDTNWALTKRAANYDHTLGTNNTGGGVAHNNMPPYIAVYMWKRVE